MKLGYDIIPGSTSRVAARAPGARIDYAGRTELGEQGRPDSLVSEPVWTARGSANGEDFEIFAASMPDLKMQLGWIGGFEADEIDDALGMRIGFQRDAGTVNLDTFFERMGAGNGDSKPYAKQPEDPDQQPSEYDTDTLPDTTAHPQPVHTDNTEAGDGSGTADPRRTTPMDMRPMWPPDAGLIASRTAADDDGVLGERAIGRRIRYELTDARGPAEQRRTTTGIVTGYKPGSHYIVKHDETGMEHYVGVNDPSARLVGAHDQPEGWDKQGARGDFADEVHDAEIWAPGGDDPRPNWWHGEGMPSEEDYEAHCMHKPKTADMGSYFDAVDDMVTQLTDAQTPDDVIRILGPESASSGEAFFGGDGDEMLGALQSAGWSVYRYEATYQWVAKAPDGGLISYTEGDVSRGDNPSAGQVEASRTAASDNPYDDDFENPYASGKIPTPDTMGYIPFAVMDDGGVLCEQCVRDPSNPVHPARDDIPSDGWGIQGWDSTDNTDEGVICDHCGKVIQEPWDEHTAARTAGPSTRENEPTIWNAWDNRDSGGTHHEVSWDQVPDLDGNIGTGMPQRFPENMLGSENEPASGALSFARQLQDKGRGNVTVTTVHPSGERKVIWQGGHTAAKYGGATIDGFRKIVETSTRGKVGGQMVDLFSAGAVTQVYDALKPENQAKFEAMGPAKMVDVAFKVLNKNAMLMTAGDVDQDTNDQGEQSAEKSERDSDASGDPIAQALTPPGGEGGSAPGGGLPGGGSDEAGASVGGGGADVAELAALASRSAMRHEAMLQRTSRAGGMNSIVARHAASHGDDEFGLEFLAQDEWDEAPEKNEDEVESKTGARRTADANFFYEHAGYSYPTGGDPEAGHQESAANLAAAEQWAKDNDYTFEWEPDIDDSLEGAWACLMKSPSGEVVQSLGGIQLEGMAPPEVYSAAGFTADPYCRVVEAELASEEMP